jgi:uncharacterized protein
LLDDHALFPVRFGDKASDVLREERWHGDETGLLNGFCRYNNHVAITYDLAKRAEALDKRGLDFEDASVVFDGPIFEVEDLRMDYGEKRIICFGMLRDRMVVVGYTPRGADCHVFSMRKANDREQARVAPLLGV